MGKYFVVIGSLFLILCIIFLFLSYVSPFKTTFLSQNQIQLPKAQLYFSPKSVTSDCVNSAYSVPIYLSSFSTSVNSVQIELSFDPALIYNVLLTPAANNFFGNEKTYTVTLEEVREQYGRASLALSLNPDQVEVKGNKPVANLSFTITSLVPDVSSQISFLNKSTVNSTETENSLLEKSNPFTIFCSSELRNTSTPSSQLNPPR